MSNCEDDENEEDEEETEVDTTNDEKLNKCPGPEKMDLLVQAFEEASADVLHSPEEDAYVDAMHTNLLVLEFLLLGVMGHNWFGSNHACFGKVQNGEG